MHRTKVKVAEDALDANETIARANRDDFDRNDVRVVNLMSAPGAGKTTLLERVLGRHRRPAAGVLEGDVQGSSTPTGSPRCTSRSSSSTPTPASAASATSTPTWCARRSRTCRSTSIDLLVIENVGNLVCPAEFRIGEDARVMVSSVTEGEDKPLKYPLMFRACELVVVNKIDLLPHLDFDMDRFLATPRRRAPGRRARCSSAPAPARAWTRSATGSSRLPDGRAGARRVTQTVADAASERRGCGRAERVLRGRGRRGSRGSATAWPSASPAAAAWSRSARSPAARSDVRHVAVEFVHPVIVGKRALPAIGLAAEGGPLAPRPTLLAEPDDIAIAFGAEDGGARRARRWRRPASGAASRSPSRRVGAEWEFEPPSDDPFVAPGARRDALPPALGARPRLLRPPRPARGPRGAAVHDTGALELPLPVPRRGETDLERGRGRRAGVGAHEGGGGRRAARPDPGRQPRRAGRRRRGAAASFDAGRQAARARQRRLGHGRDGCRRRLPRAARRQGGRRARRSTSPRTPRSSPRSPTTSASRRSSSAR